MSSELRHPVQFNFRMNDDLLAMLDMVAKSFGLSRSAAMRVLIKAGYEKLGYSQKNASDML